MKKTILLLVLLLLLVPVASAQQSKISTKDTEDYRDMSVTPEGFQIKDPYALPVYEPKSTSLLPFHERISVLLNSYLGRLLSNFDVKEAFALRILFEDFEPLLSFLGDLLSLPITCIALPLLSIARLIKAPFDILEFLITAILDPIFSIPAHEIALLRSFVSSLRNALRFPLKALKPIEFLLYTPDPLRSLPDSLSLVNSFSALYSSTLQPLISLVSAVMDYIPFLNVMKAFINTYILPVLKAPLKLFSFLSPYANDPHVSSLINLISLPFSLPLIALQQLLSLIKDLLSVILLPVLFVLRIPLTPLLILFNFVGHSLSGLLYSLRTLSVLFFAPLILVSLPLAVLPAIILGLLTLLSALSIAFLIPSILFGGMGAVIGALIGALITFIGSSLLSLIAIAAFTVIGFFGLPLLVIIMYGAAGFSLGLVLCILGILFGFLAGVLIGAIVSTALSAIGHPIIGTIAAVLIIIGLTIIGGAAGLLIPPVLLAIAGALIGVLMSFMFLGFMLLISIPAAIAGGIVGLILLGMLAVPLVAGLGAVISAIPGVIAGIPFAILSLPAAILIALPVTMVSIPVFAVLITLMIEGLITGLIAGLGPLAPLLLIPVIILVGILLVISAVSPELFRVLIPPELTALLARAGSLPTDITRIINGLAHLPVDTMRAIAVLDAPAMAAMTADGGGGGSEIEHREANFTATIILYNETGEPLSEEDVKALQNATQNLNLTSVSQAVEGASKATSAVLGAESDLLQKELDALKKIPPTAEVSLEITRLDTGVTVLSEIMTAAEALEMMSNLTDSDPGNDPDISSWTHLTGDVAETIAKGFETAYKGTQTVSTVASGLSAGITIVTGSVDLWEAAKKHQNKEINDYQFRENITATSIDMVVGVVSVWFPIVGAIYYPIDFALEQTIGKGAGESTYTAGYVSVEGGKIIYTTFVVPTVERAVNTVAEFSIAQAQAEAAAGEAIISGAKSLVTGAAEASLRLYLWLISLFSIVLMLSLQQEAVI
jgi:hypothetical protein